MAPLRLTDDLRADIEHFARITFRYWWQRSLRTSFARVAEGLCMRAAAQARLDAEHELRSQEIRRKLLESFGERR